MQYTGAGLGAINDAGAIDVPLTKQEFVGVNSAPAIKHELAADKCIEDGVSRVCGQHSTWIQSGSDKGRDPEVIGPNGHGFSRRVPRTVK